MPVLAQRKRYVTIIGPDLTRLLELSIALRPLFETTIIESQLPLRDAARALASAPECVVARITQRDSAGDVRELVAAAASTRILFLAESLPLRPAVARVIRESGHTTLARTECMSVIEATLVAMLACAADAP